MRLRERRLRALRAAMAGRLSEGVVAALADIRLVDLRAATRRQRRIAEARQIGMYLLHTVFRESHARAGRAFGRDRTTARHAVMAIAKPSKSLISRQHHAARITGAPLGAALEAWADRFAELVAETEGEP